MSTATDDDTNSNLDSTKWLLKVATQVQNVKYLRLNDFEILTPVTIKLLGQIQIKVSMIIISAHFWSLR